MIRPFGNAFNSGAGVRLVTIWLLLATLAFSESLPEQIKRLESEIEIGREYCSELENGLTEKDKTLRSKGVDSKNVALLGQCKNATAKMEKELAQALALQKKIEDAGSQPTNPYYLEKGGPT